MPVLAAPEVKLRPNPRCSRFSWSRFPLDHMRTMWKRGTAMLKGTTMEFGVDRGCGLACPGSHGIEDRRNDSKKSSQAGLRGLKEIPNKILREDGKQGAEQYLIRGWTLVWR